jgi:hypothetical protein
LQLGDGKVEFGAQGLAAFSVEDAPVDAASSLIRRMWAICANSRWRAKVAAGEPCDGGDGLGVGEVVDVTGLTRHWVAGAAGHPVRKSTTVRGSVGSVVVSVAAHQSV